MAIEAIIFDFYGTLVQANSKINPFKRIHAATNIERVAFRKELLTRNTEAGLMSLFAEWEVLGSDFSAQGFFQELQINVESVELFPEVREILLVLREKFSLFLLTNLSSPYRAPFYTLGLEGLLSPYFSCERGVAKPDREFFELVLLENGLQPENCLMVGDSLKSDIEPARLLGMSTLHLKRPGMNLNAVLDVVKRPG